MASRVSTHKVRNEADRLRHMLFPSLPATLVALAVEGVALACHLPVPRHVLVAVATHAAIGCVHRGS